MKTLLLSLLLASSLSFAASPVLTGQGRIQINGGNIFPCERVEIESEQAQDIFWILSLKAICQRQSIIDARPIGFEIVNGSELWRDGKKVGYLMQAGFGFRLITDAQNESAVALSPQGDLSVRLTKKVPGQPLQTAVLNAQVR